MGLNSLTSPLQYEDLRPKTDPEITLDRLSKTAEENARRILDHLITQGFVRAPH